MNKRWVEVPEGYRCPFCPDHDDDNDDFFIWDLILKQPICRGCTYDLYYALLEANKEETIGIDLLHRLEELTGKPAIESALDLVRAEITYMEKEENLQAMIANPKQIPPPTEKEIRLLWQEELDQFKTILAELIQLSDQ